MNDKGFTLIEIIIVVAIIAVAGLVVTINLTNTLDKANQKRCDEFVRKIEDAACAYTSMSKKNITCNPSKCEPIELSKLIEEGYIEEDIDTCTGNDINENETVSISWVNGEKTCHYNGDRYYAK